MHSIAPGIFVLERLKTGRAYLVEGDGGLALIDTSTGDASNQILAGFEAAGHRPEELRAIVATHYHHDHTGNVAALVNRSGAELYVYDVEAPYVDGRERWLPLGPPFGFFEKTSLKQYSLTIDRHLNDGDVLPYADGLRVIHSPGHTPGHISLYAEERGVLFAGDAMMNVLGLRLPLAAVSHDMTAARASVHRLAKLDFEIALPGHGAPIIGRADEKIREWVKTWL